MGWRDEEGKLVPIMMYLSSVPEFLVAVPLIAGVYTANAESLICHVQLSANAS
jgi:hypothetical protein